MSLCPTCGRDGKGELQHLGPLEMLLPGVGAVCAIGSFPWCLSVRLWDDLIYQGVGCPGLCPMAG